jgi:hypothetical protein
MNSNNYYSHGGNPSVPILAVIGASVVVVVIIVIIALSVRKSKRASAPAPSPAPVPVPVPTPVQSLVEEKVIVPIAPPIPEEQAPIKFYGEALGQWSGSPFVLKCNKNENDYVSSIIGRSGAYVDNIGVQCMSGEHPAATGGQGGTPFTIAGQNGFTEINGRAGWGIDNILGKGGQGGNYWEHKCPTGTKVRAIHGKSGQYIGSVGFSCK